MTETQTCTLAQLVADPTLLPIRTDVRWKEFGGFWQYGRLIDVKVTSLGEYVIVYNHRSDHSGRRSDYLPGNRVVEVVTQANRQTTYEMTVSELPEGHFVPWGPYWRFGHEIEVTDIHGKRHRGRVRGLFRVTRGLTLTYSPTIVSGLHKARVESEAVVTVFKEMD